MIFFSYANDYMDTERKNPNIKFKNRCQEEDGSLSFPKVMMFIYYVNVKSKGCSYKHTLETQQHKWKQRKRLQMN